MKRLAPLFLLIICSFGTFAYATQTLQYEVKGVTGDPLTNVENRLASLKDSYGAEISLNEIQNFYQLAPRNIQKALEPYGYFKAKIQPSINHSGSKWYLQFFIKPGPTLMVHDVAISMSGSGKFNPALQKKIAQFPIKAGQTLNIEQYNKAKTDLLQTAYNEGYLKAELYKVIHINLRQYNASINLELNTGERYYFGQITFNKNAFSEKFLKRFISIHEAEPFSSEKLLKFQQDLSNSRYFTDVMVTPQINQAENYAVPIAVDLSLPKSQQYNFGIGYGTYTGPRLSIGADFRRIGNEGQHLTASLKYSTVLKAVAAKYYIPGKNPLNDQYTIGLDVQKFTPKNAESFSQTLSGGYATKFGRWQNVFTLNYLNEHYQIENQEKEFGRSLYPNYTLSRIKADDLIKPNFATSFYLTLRGATEQIVSTTSFVQGEVKGKYIATPGSLGRIILRGDVGYTAVNDLEKLPASLRFYAGGLGSVRGYGYSSIGPGRYLKVGSVEYQHPIYKEWSGAVFYDVGTAANHFNDPLNVGIGFGIIYNSMIGPIQVYVAQAQSKRSKPHSIEISIGPDL